MLLGVCSPWPFHPSIIRISFLNSLATTFQQIYEETLAGTAAAGDSAAPQKLDSVISGDGGEVWSVIF